MIYNKLCAKMDEVLVRQEEISRVAVSLVGYDTDSVAVGVIAGQMYNAFYYQTRRILGRDPTPAEFDEFLEFVQYAMQDIR